MKTHENRIIYGELRKAGTEMNFRLTAQGTHSFPIPVFLSSPFKIQIV